MNQQRSVIFTPEGGPALTLHDGQRNAPLRILSGARGLEAPMVEVEMAGAPLIDGNVLVGSRIAGRRITLPIEIRANTEAEFSATITQLAAAIARPRPGSLRVISRNADRRLNVIYTGGLEGNENTPVHRVGRWWRIEVDFEAIDPWWRDTSSESVTFQQSTQRPFFPFTLATGPSGVSFPLNPSATFGEYIGSYSGDAPAPVTVQATGPATAVEVTISGVTFRAETTIIANGSVSWHLDPRNPNVGWTWGTWEDRHWPWDPVHVADGWPVIGRASAGGGLVVVPESNVVINAHMEGANATSRLQVRWNPRYRSWRSAA